MFENRVLRRMFSPKEKKVRGNWTKLLDLHNMYLSQNTVGIIK
jgi:hypothetical protein